MAAMSIGAMVSATIDLFVLNISIPVSHINRRSIKIIIGVVVNRLVGMGLKGNTYLAIFARLALESAQELVIGGCL